ncbi:MAG: peptidylprolyl isomerase [Bryobacteraceae bacterium]|nr:peptidylprolyl isomerase [Bryobacteraceae bacterium]
MRRSLPLFLFAVSCAFSQISAPPAGLIEVTPDAVIAFINGRKFTVGDFERLLPALNPNLQKLVASQPKAGLQEYALVDLLTREAEKLKLDQDPKLLEKLAEARRQMLAVALIQKQTELTKVPEEDVRKYYEANLESMREAQVRIVFVSRAQVTQSLGAGGSTTQAEASAQKEKAGLVAKLAREGKDFAELAKQYSDDRDSAANGGVLPVKIRPGVANMPKEMTEPVLTAAKGDIIGPLEHETGWYVMRVETVGVPELEAARPDIEKQLKDARLRSWYEQLRAKASVQMENDAFWQTFVATNKKDDGSKGAAR